MKRRSADGVAICGFDRHHPQDNRNQGDSESRGDKSTRQRRDMAFSQIPRGSHSQQKYCAADEPSRSQPAELHQAFVISQYPHGVEWYERSHTPRGRPKATTCLPERP